MKTDRLSDTADHISKKALDNSATRLVPTDSILAVARSGVLAHSFPVALIDKPMAFNQDIKALVPNRELVLPEYLFYFLRYREHEIVSRGVKKGATVHSLQSAYLENLEVPLPQLQDQQGIVDILKRADGIRRLRKQARDTARQFIPALFVDMFGDPATNSEGWPMAAFGDAGRLDRGKSKHRPRNDPALFGGNYPFIQTGDVAKSGGRIAAYSTTYNDAGLAQSKLWPKGTLCITIAANIADAAVLDFDACFPDSVVGFIPSERVTTEFVQYWLGFLKPTLEASAPQLAQKNINLKILRQLPMILPPLELQEEFSRRVEAVWAIQTQQAASMSSVSMTFEALMAQVFGGSKLTQGSMDGSAELA